MYVEDNLTIDILISLNFPPTRNGSIDPTLLCSQWVALKSGNQIYHSFKWIQCRAGRRFWDLIFIRAQSFRNLESQLLTEQGFDFWTLACEDFVVCSDLPGDFIDPQGSHIIGNGSHRLKDPPNQQVPIIVSFNCHSDLLCT